MLSFFGIDCFLVTKFSFFLEKMKDWEATVYFYLQHLSVDDEYLLDKKWYSLVMRPVSGNVSLPEHTFTTPNFMPHGCLCVYNSLASLDYLRDSLDKTLIACDRGSRCLQGLPVVLALAHNPQLVGQLCALRERGIELAAR